MIVKPTVIKEKYASMPTYRFEISLSAGLPRSEVKVGIIASYFWRMYIKNKRNNRWESIQSDENRQAIMKFINDNYKQFDSYKVGRDESKKDDNFNGYYVIHPKSSCNIL